jgi:hypothetical protein
MFSHENVLHSLENTLYAEKKKWIASGLHLEAKTKRLHHVFASAAKQSSLCQVEFHSKTQFYPEKWVKPILLITFLLIDIVFSSTNTAYIS